MNRRIILVSGEGGVCEDVRLRPFLPASEEEEFTIEFVPIARWTELRLADYASFVIQRDHSDQGLRVHRSLRAQGRPTIYEIDDLLWDLPAYSRYVSTPEDRSRILEHLRIASRVVVSTDTLASLVGVYSPAVSTILNAPPMVERTGRIRILLASVDALKVADFGRDFCRAVSDVIRDYDAELWIIGDIDAVFELPRETMIRLPVMSRDRYLRLVSAIAPHLALVPLEESLYASCKSDIKLLDFAALGIPALYSNVPPYAGVIRHRETGWLVPNTPYDWISCLREAIEDTALHSAMKQALAKEDARFGERLAAGRLRWRELIQELTS